MWYGLGTSRHALKLSFERLTRMREAKSVARSPAGGRG